LQPRRRLVHDQRGEKNGADPLQRQQIELRRRLTGAANRDLAGGAVPARRSAAAFTDALFAKIAPYEGGSFSEGST